MPSPLNQFAAATAAFALCISPTMATAATTAHQPVSPLVAVSIFGTQASAQAVCSQAASAAAAAGTAAAAQEQTGCVLPATDVPPPVGEAPVPPPLLPGTNFGVNWLLLGLGALAAIAGLSTLFDDDDDVDITPVSPN